MNTVNDQKKSTPVMSRPSRELRLKTGLRAGDGGITHTDNWREGTRR